MSSKYRRPLYVNHSASTWTTTSATADGEEGGTGGVEYVAVFGVAATRLVASSIRMTEKKARLKVAS